MDDTDVAPDDEDIFYRARELSLGAGLHPNPDEQARQLAYYGTFAVSRLLMYDCTVFDLLGDAEWLARYDECYLLELIGQGEIDVYYFDERDGEFDPCRE